MFTAIPDFQLANKIYSGATASFYTVLNGVKTAVLAPLFADPSGIMPLQNPQTLSSDGRFKQAVYVNVPVIATLSGSGLAVPSHDTGIINPAPTFRVDEATGKFQFSYDNGVTWNDTGDFIFKYRGAWVTATLFNRNDMVIQGGVLYFATTGHTSGVFATDLAAGKWMALVTLTTANISGISAFMQTVLPAADAATALSDLNGVAKGLTTASGLTMNTGRLLGRTTAGAGAIEEISAGAGVSIAGGQISATSASLPDFLLTSRGTI